jgi:surface protein
MIRRFRPFMGIKKGGLPFVFEINTANTSTGSTTDTQFKLPLRSSGTYNFSVDWGDSSSNTITTWDQAETTHTYASSGTYTITISGQIEGFSFISTGDRLKILDISQWGSLSFLSNGTTTDGPFRLCANLNISATDRPVFFTGPQVAFFEGCTSMVFNDSINGWDVSPITNLARFFLNCSSFNQPIGDWDISNVDIISIMFQGCSVFNQNLSDWDMSGVTNCHSMFRDATAFNNGGDSGINNWNVSNVTIFGGTNQGMFQGATNFNQPIGNWTVSAGTSMRQMFNNAINFNQNIGGWNVGNVTNFTSMFQSATAFNQNIGGWNVAKASLISNFMASKTAANYSAANLDAIYNGWSALTFVNTGLTISFNTIKYTAAGSSGRAILTGAPNNWTITDGGI